MIIKTTVYFDIEGVPQLELQDFVEKLSEITTSIIRKEKISVLSFSQPFRKSNNYLKEVSLKAITRAAAMESLRKGS